MTKLILFISFVAVTNLTFGQWTPVSISGSSAPVTELFSDPTGNLVVGTDGDGIFMSADGGLSFTDISGNIANKSINYLSGELPLLLVGTENGAFFTADLADYINVAPSGLASNDINYFNIGYSSFGNHTYALCTNGGGIYTAPELAGPWNSSNAGITGNGLVINNLSGYYDPQAVTYNLLATNNGPYFSYDSLNTWSSAATGLTGDALTVKDALALGPLPVIATHAGLFASLDYGMSWMPLLPDVKLNILETNFMTQMYYVFGEGNYFSADLLNWSPINMNGLPAGEVVAATVTSDYIYVATVPSDKSINSGGTLYKAPYNQVVAVDQVISNRAGSLSQNFPNPVKDRATIEYRVFESGMVTLTLFDVTGREVKQLVNEAKTAGDHEISFSTATLSNGVYYYSLRVNNGVVASKKMIIGR